MYCKKCGVKLLGNAHYCTECGTNIYLASISDISISDKSIEKSTYNKSTQYAVPIIISIFIVLLSFGDWAKLLHININDIFGNIFNERALYDNATLYNIINSLSLVKVYLPTILIHVMGLSVSEYETRSAIVEIVLKGTLALMYIIPILNALNCYKILTNRTYHKIKVCVQISSIISILLIAVFIIYVNQISKFILTYIAPYNTIPSLSGEIMKINSVPYLILMLSVINFIIIHLLNPKK